MRPRLLPNFFSATLLVFAAGCAAHRPAPEAVRRDQITQVSQINALMLGHYEGATTLRELLRYGNFGLGTFDHLDGEMIVLDGRVWQAKSDGAVVEASLGMTTPFAVVTPFASGWKAACPPAGSLKGLEAQLDALLPNQNAFYAIRFEADLESITLRSVPRQEPPYKPLAEVAERQKIWSRPDVRGELVGIRSPKWVGNLNVPGYHWHFLGTDRKLGGHIFDCRIRGGKIAYERCGQWLVKPNTSIDGGSDLTQDLSRDLEKVEKRRDQAAPSPTR